MVLTLASTKLSSNYVSTVVSVLNMLDRRRLLLTTRSIYRGLSPVFRKKISREFFSAQYRMFCSVLWPSSIRGLVTSWPYFLHLSLSSVFLTDFSTGSLVHVFMLSIQAVRGLPGLRASGIVPYIISFSRQLPCYLVV